MSFCQFVTKYFDTKKEIDIFFYCDEEALENGLCIFHDKNYLGINKSQEHQKTVRERFLHKIKKSSVDQTPLYCIGYSLPDLEIHENFMGPVNFSFSKFRKIDFSGSKFNAEADFSSCIFSEEADFLSCVFNKEANFSLVGFLTEADFSSCTFSQDARFFGIKSSGRIYFLGAKFSKAEFHSSSFSALADFTSAEFTQEVNFIQVKFNEVIFSKSKFNSKSNFNLSHFLAEANFLSTNFYDEVNFSGCEFLGVILFSNSNFYGHTNFFSVIFHGTTYFSSSKFLGETYFSGEFKGETSFNSAWFGYGENILFDLDDLSNVSFSNTDITKVRFYENVIWGKIHPFKIFDEVKMESLERTNWDWGRLKLSYKKDNAARNHERAPERISIESIITIYRNLRENYGYRFRYYEMSQFYIREMELKRNYSEIYSKGSLIIRKNNFFRRNFSFIGLYYHLARYGESLFRPLIFGIAIITFSTLFWLISYDSTAFQSSIATDDLVSGIKISLERSIGNFLVLPSPGREEGLGDYITKSLAIADLVLIGIALRRKFERKFRS
jgi:uncharacterized protein YjbI with pentapeptide repeats